MKRAAGGNPSAIPRTNKRKGGNRKQGKPTGTALFFILSGLAWVVPSRIFDYSISW